MAQINFKSVTEAFLQLEVELDLFEKKIDGVYFWEMIRFPLHRQILRNLGITGEEHTILDSTFVNRGRSYWRGIKNVFTKNPFLAPKGEILFLGSERRKLKDDRKWWDIYCDPIIEELNRSYVYFELPYLNTHLFPPKTARIWYLDFPFHLAAARRKIGTAAVSLKKNDTVLLKETQKQLETQYNIRIDLKGLVELNLLFRKSVLPVFKRLLERVSPKVVVLVCSYGKETFIEACKDLEIPVVELQHGVVDRYHLGYSFPRPGRKKRTFPDYFFVFGDFWKKRTEYPIGQERIYSVGYPYLESEAKKYLDVKKRDQLVFISQGTIGKKMSEFAFEISKRKHFPFTIVYKLHPGEYTRWRIEYPWLIESEIRVVDSDQVPLYQLFAESRIQIGVNSTAIYEGLNFGLSTILLNLPGVEYMDYLIEKQVANLVTSVDELLGSLKGEKHYGIETEFFFKSNSLDNIVKTIDKILSPQKALYSINADSRL